MSHNKHRQTITTSYTQNNQHEFNSFHTATYRITPQFTATYRNAPQYIATHRNTPQHTPTNYNISEHTATYRNTPQHIATHRNTPQHTTTYRIIPQHTATYRKHSPILPSMSFDSNNPTTPESLLASGFCLRKAQDANSAARLQHIIGSLYHQRFSHVKGQKGHELYRAALFLLRVNDIKSQEHLKDFTEYHDWYIPAKCYVDNKEDLAVYYFLELRPFIKFAIYLARITTAAAKFNYEIDDNASLQSLTAWFEAVERLNSLESTNSTLQNPGK